MSLFCVVFSACITTVKLPLIKKIDAKFPRIGRVSGKKTETDKPIAQKLRKKAKYNNKQNWL